MFLHLPMHQCSATSIGLKEAATLEWAGCPASVEGEEAVGGVEDEAAGRPVPDDQLCLLPIQKEQEAPICRGH